MRTYHLGLTGSHDGLTIKAFTCVLIVLTSYLAIRTMYRTIRHMLSMVTFMIRWGLVLYLIFFLWLWWTEGRDQSGLPQSLAATYSMMQNAGVAATALLWQLSQRPDTWQSIARHVHSVLQPSKPKNRRAPKRRGTHTPEDDMAELVHALGWDKWLNSLTSPQQHKKRWNPTPTRWKKERY